MAQPKLILLNGPAGVGKTTIAQLYIDDNPLAMSISGDDLIAMMGQWLQYEPQARTRVFELTKLIARAQLQAGHDVVLPYLLTRADHADEFEGLARECDAQFIEVVLLTDKSEATRRLFKRGTWGERNAPALTQADKPEAERLYDDMTLALTARPNTIKIVPIEDDIDGTYHQFLKAIGQKS